MVPFVVAEALRRVRRSHGGGRARVRRLPMSRLLLGEARHQLVAASRPAVLVVVLGLVAMAGLHVALGGAYPGPVAPGPLRWVVALAGLVAVVGLARTVPPSWRQLRATVARDRVWIGVVGLASAASLVKVGLHDTTPGPVLPATGRWIAMALVTALVVGALADRGARR